MKRNPTPALRDRLLSFAPWILGLCGLAAYANTFAVPFLFDDLQSIADNPRLASFWSFVLDPGDIDSTLSGRPVAALTIALNGAAGGLDVVGYHVVNLAIHVLAGLLLFGVVRRTLALPRLAERFAGAQTSIAFVVALLWLLHPLQTKAVTYVVQRVESLAALFALLCLYAYLRGSTGGSRRRWFSLAVVASALAMGTKETAAAIPLLVLLHDRMFVAGSLGAAWRARGQLYLALAATWVVLIVLVAVGPRLRVAEEAAVNVTPLAYAQTQCRAIFHYLALVAWPRRLIFDYGMAGDGVPLLTRASEWLPWAAALLALVALTLFGVVKNRAWSFAAATFFLVLLPTSSFLPIKLDVIAEHRMYLPLAAIIALVVCGLDALLRRTSASATSRANALVAVGIAISLALGARTIARNRDYASELAIWSDTVAKRPGSARAQTNLGLALDAQGDFERSAEHHREALRLRPDYAEAHHNLATALMNLRRPAEAEVEYRAALAHSRDSYETRLGLGEALVQQNKLDEAAEQFERALAVRNDLFGAHMRLAAIRQSQERLDEAALHYGEALRLDPNAYRLRNQLGIVLAQQGKLAPAAEQFRRALAIQPDFADARTNLERVLAQTPSR